MPIITLNLVTPDGTEMEDCNFPDDVLVKEIADDIINQLGYPMVDDQNIPVEYYFENGKGVRLQSDQKLSDADVATGDTLFLKSATRVTAPQIRNSGNHDQPPPPRGNLDIAVQLLETHRNVVERFSEDQKVGEILNQMIAKHNLPARDTKFKDGKIYQIFSKTSGTQLLEDLTLREAGIPNGDTFVIATDEIPG